MYKKDLHDPDNHNGVITHLQQDILECEVKWALGSITTNKASGGGGIPVEVFQILKDDAVTMLHSICQQIWKTQQWPQDWKMSVFIPVPEKGNVKECSNYHAIALISHASKVILKLVQARLQQYMSCESAALSMSANLENSAVAVGLEKVFIPVPKKGSSKECSNYCTIALISHEVK